MNIFHEQNRSLRKEKKAQEDEIKSLTEKLQKKRRKISELREDLNQMNGRESIFSLEMKIHDLNAENMEFQRKICNGIISLNIY